MTEEETEDIFTIERFSKKKPIKDNLEIFDYKNAIKFILEQADASTIISGNFIKKVNEQVLKNTGPVINTAVGTVDASKGEYRLSTVLAGETIFPDAVKIDVLMKTFVNNYIDIKQKTVIEAIHKAADIHFDFVSIHPFYDGNGRTARLLMNFVMQINGLPFIVLNKEDKTEYIGSLRKTREKEDLNIFRDFIKNQYGEYLKKELELLKDNNKNKNLFLSF